MENGRWKTSTARKPEKKKYMKGTVKELPSREAIDVPVDEMLIVELYSK